MKIGMILLCRYDSTRLHGKILKKIKYEINSHGAETTIIIPVYNQLEVTLRCLATLVSIDSKNKFKVIIVDDCSIDDLSMIKVKFPNIQIFLKAILKRGLHVK